MRPERQRAVEQAAARLFSSQGYRGTSIADIAGSAGVSRSAIYLAAPSKLGLYFQVLHARIGDCVRGSIAEIDGDAPAGDQLRQAFFEQLAWMYDEPMVRELLVERIDADDPTWRPRFEELRRLGRSPMAQRIAVGQQRGELDTTVPADEVARMLQDLQVSVVLLHPEEAHACSGRLARALELVLRGLQVNE